MTDVARFEAFVREYQDMVFATAVRLLGRESDAEDDCSYDRYLLSSRNDLSLKVRVRGLSPL